MAECPSSFATLGDFLESRDFDTSRIIGRFFGRDLDEPNSRSRISGTEFPVEQRMSIADRRKTHTLRSSRAASRYYQPTTDAALEARQKRAQEGTGASSENDQTPWEVQAMNYFNDRLDEIQESMVRAFSGVMADQSRLHTRIDALVAEVTKANDERSESRRHEVPRTENKVRD